MDRAPLKMFIFVATLVLSAPAWAIEPSFDCNKTRPPDESTICNSDRLASLDLLAAFGYNFIRNSGSPKQANEANIPHIRDRQQCMSVAACIQRSQIAAIRTFQGLGAPINESQIQQALNQRLDGKTSSLAPAPTNQAAPSIPPTSTNAICPTDTKEFWDKCMGRAILESKAIYEGSWKDDAATGIGLLHYENGDRYVGQVNKGNRVGRGVLTYKNGNQYDGSFEDGKYQGKGTLIIPNGEQYFGDFINEKKTGIGRTKFSNGDEYIGGYQDGVFNGTGVYIQSNGEKYIGDHLLGKRSGNGTYLWPNSDRYVGQFIEGQRTGLGTFTWAVGNIYTGTFKEGKPDGPGTFRWKNGDLFQGTFVSDLAEGNGQLLAANGERYVGDFHQNQKHGRGTLFAADGSHKASGVWHRGTLITPDQLPIAPNSSSNQNGPPVSAPPAGVPTPSPILNPPQEPQRNLDAASFLESLPQLQNTLFNGLKNLFDGKIDDIGAPLITLIVAIASTALFSLIKLRNRSERNTSPGSNRDGTLPLPEDHSYATEWSNILKVPVECSAEELDDAYWMALKNLNGSHPDKSDSGGRLRVEDIAGAYAFAKRQRNNPVNPTG